ncbi:MAG TPA: FAD-dependent oxidoreductase [Acidimicrobiales bacterium]
MTKSERPYLSSPFAIRDVVLRNRIVFQPHFTALGHGGSPSADLIAYYEERAAGGVGLVIVEGQAVMPSGKDSHRVIEAYEPDNVALYAEMVERVHAQGAAMFCQLTHSGPDSLESRPEVMLAPSHLSGSVSLGASRAMDSDDIESLRQGFRLSAHHAKAAHFDGVEIKVGHDGILRAFASPHSNRRVDEYGGSFENRMRLIIEVINTVRDEVGPDYVVGVRICLSEFTPWGYDAEYGLKMASYIEQTEQIDYFNCDAGTALNYWMQIPPAAIPEGHFRQLNTALKRCTSLPIIAFGRIKRPEMAEEMIAMGQADLIGMARQLIADPDTALKITEGREEDIRFCMASNDSCIFQVAREHPIRCDHNPAAGREVLLSERRLKMAPEPKSVLVIGGGPAGMKAAETLARRGHQVTLFEKQKMLGGQVLLAMRQPEHVEIFESIDYLERQLRRLQVEVHLGVEITSQDIAEFSPDAIVLASGSRPALPGMIGANGSAEIYGCCPDLTEDLPLGVLGHGNAFSVDDAMRIDERGEGNVVVVDITGHWDSVGTAEYLSNLGYQVSLITKGHMVGASLEESSRVLFYDRAAARGMNVLAMTEVVSNDGSTVRLRNVFTGGETDVSDVRILVAAIGREPTDGLYREWLATGSGTPIHRVGDCVAPRLLRATIAEAYDLGRRL